MSIYHFYATILNELKETAPELEKSLKKQIVKDFNIGEIFVIGKSREYVAKRAKGEI